MKNYLILPIEVDGFAVRVRSPHGMELAQSFRTVEEAQAWINEDKLEKPERVERPEIRTSANWDEVAAA